MQKGQLGHGDFLQRNIPTVVEGLKNVKIIGGKSSHTRKLMLSSVQSVYFQHILHDGVLFLDQAREASTTRRLCLAMGSLTPLAATKRLAQTEIGSICIYVHYCQTACIRHSGIYCFLQGQCGTGVLKSNPKSEGTCKPSVPSCTTTYMQLCHLEQELL